MVWRERYTKSRTPNQTIGKESLRQCCLLVRLGKRRTAVFIQRVNSLWFHLHGTCGQVSMEFLLRCWWGDGSVIAAVRRVARRNHYGGGLNSGF
jgi:hypothetical protein